MIYNKDVLAILNEVVAQQTSILHSMMPPLEAFGIGGAFGSATIDEYSDVDFFLLYSDEHIFKILHDLPRVIQHSRQVISRSGLDFFPGFGFAFSFLLDGPISVDYYLNCRETMALNPMRVKTRVLYDSTGFMTELCRKPSFTEKSTSQSHCQGMMHDYLIKLMKIRKCLKRGDRAYLIYNLDNLRLTMIAVDRLLSRGEDYNAIQADRHILSDMGEEYENWVCTTFPSRQADSIWQAFTQIRERITGQLKATCLASVQYDNFWQLEEEIASDIIESFREMSCKSKP